MIGASTAASPKARAGRRDHQLAAGQGGIPGPCADGRAGDPGSVDEELWHRIVLILGSQVAAPPSLPRRRSDDGWDVRRGENSSTARARFGSFGAPRTLAQDARYSSDEHVQPVGPDMTTATPLGPPRAQTAQEQHAGLLELDAQPSVASTRLPEGAAPEVSAPVQGRRAHVRTPTTRTLEGS